VPVELIGQLPGEVEAVVPVPASELAHHELLMDLKQQMKEGDTVPLTLVVEGKDKKRSTIEVKAPVKPLAAAAGAKMETQHKH
jgi:copper(I)-binding protein